MSPGRRTHRYRLAGAALIALLALPGEPPASPGRTDLTLLFTGDVLVHTPVAASAAAYGRLSGRSHDFSPMFAEVAPVISAVDWAVCHLEVSLGVPGVPTSPFPRIAAPAAVADALAQSGFDACSTSSNHALDFGAPGVESTIAALEGAGVAHTGTATSPGSANGILYQVGGVTVGHASYSYGFNGFTLPPDQPWLANQIDPDRILGDAARLRRVGAEVVVISLHWGAEYRPLPIAYQTDLAQALTSSPDIDLVIGHHAHVVQPLSWWGDTPVAFGLGNFLSNQTDQLSEDGVMLIVRLAPEGEEWKVEEVGAVPTWVDRRQGHVIRDALGGEGRFLASAGRTGAALDLLGEGPPLYSVEEARRWVLADVIAARMVRLCRAGAC
ncbi:MAG TPA: CapA family protein [Acidimicrobiia bacterium]|nr:CapA family protein [Acidimicrobiia bacterium]